MIFPTLIMRKGDFCETWLRRPELVDLTDGAEKVFSPDILAVWTGIIALVLQFGLLLDLSCPEDSTTLAENCANLSTDGALLPLNNQDRSNESMRSTCLKTNKFSNNSSNI